VPEVRFELDQHGLRAQTIVLANIKNKNAILPNESNQALVLAQNLKRRLSSCGRPERPRAFQSRETPRHSRGNKSEIAGNQMEQILEAYENALAEYNITDGDARLPLQRHITPVSLIDVRFGPKVQLKDSEIQDHDNSTYLPDCRLDLGEARRQSRVRLNTKAFQ
jgi:hypothetical protein